MRLKQITYFFLANCILATGCGQNESAFYVTDNGDLAPVFSDSPIGQVNSQCTRLSFAEVTWPEELDATDIAALQLALNISGSFEGHGGWANIANNFDGQGLSLGLLNQTLGTGSLQPLLAKLKANDPSVLDVFEPNRRISLINMVSKWENSRALLTVATETEPIALSRFDYEADLLMQLYGARESESVRWAKANLYNGSTFKPEWKRELQSMASDPRYVSLQVSSAMKYHRKALSYLELLGVYEIRAYLLLFDIVVQNGGLYADDLKEYSKAFSGNPSASARTRLLKIIDLRLRHVKRQWREDVRRRKTAIVDGQGLVHGANRNLEREFCFTKSQPFQ